MKDKDINIIQKRVKETFGTRGLELFKVLCMLGFNPAGKTFWIEFNKSFKNENVLNNIMENQYGL